MTRPIRWLLRIVVSLVILGVIAIVAVVLLLDTIVREVLVSRMRAATGMGVKITSVHVGLLSPTMTIVGLKLYNTPEFGGALCLDMPELHLEYDPAGAHSGTIHLPLVRLNLADIEVVTDKHGRSNFDAISKNAGQSAAHTNSVNRFKFSGIDTLNLTLGKFHAANLGSGREEQVNFSITNEVFHNVKSEADLQGVAVLLAIRGSGSDTQSNIEMGELLNNLISR